MDELATLSKEKNLPVTIGKAELVHAFTAEGGLDSVLALIAREFENFKPDLTTPKGRKEIKSTARKVASSKVVLDEFAKNLVAEQKAVIKKVDAARKKARDYLDELRTLIRKPLTEWEEAENERIEGHKKQLAKIRDDAEVISSSWKSMPISEMDECLELLQTQTNINWQEFVLEATEVINNAIATINSAIESRKIYDIEQEEILAKEAIAKVQLEKEREQAELERKEKERISREIAVQKAREEERIQAEENSRIAVQEERLRIESAAKAKEAEIKKNKYNVEHRAKIQESIVNALVRRGVSEIIAKVVVAELSVGNIPHVKIVY